MTRDTFCSFCGAPFTDTSAYPRTCAKCSTTIWANPVPVSIVLLPVVRDGRTGLLVVRRGIQPGLGKLALVGGFLEEHETWQVGGAREMREETGVVIDAATLEPFGFVSTAPKPNRVLLFSLAPPVELAAGQSQRQVDAKALAPLAPNHETLERGLVFGPGGLDDVFAFPLHADAARRFFTRHAATGPHAFERV